MQRGVMMSVGDASITLVGHFVRQCHNFDASGFRCHLVGKTLINVFTESEIRLVGKLVIVQTLYV